MFPRIPRVKSGRLSHWPSSEMVIPNVGTVVSSNALSSDGQRVAQGKGVFTVY